MPEYHRGKARSPYRKRAVTVSLVHTDAGVEVQTVLLANSSGTTETKSWRGVVQIIGSGTAGGSTRGTGWIGFYRGQLGTNALEAIPTGAFLAQSECFGCVPWTQGYNDHLMELKLIGVTLSVAEALYVVSGCTFTAGSAVGITASLLFAEKEVPA